jgi:vancomycin resistance protein YoaR
VGIIVLTAAALALLTRDRGRIYPNVFVAGTRVAGLNRDQARQVIAAAGVLPPPDQPILVRAGDRGYRCSLRDTGASFSIERALNRAYAVGRTGSALQRLLERAASYRRHTNIALPAIVDTAQARRFAEACARRFDSPPVNASVEIQGANVRISPGKPGVKVEVADVPGAVRTWAGHGWRRDLRLPTRFLGPAVTADRLKEVDALLASVSTSLAGSSRNRRHNVARAAAAVDGFVLMPGDVFSYNEVLGPRTEEAGYRTAPVIREGKLVPGTGGGACQLSSTLYQVALRAGLETVRRSHHSRPVHYTPAGLDATVVYGLIDLKFRNNTQHPMVLRAQVRGGRLVCQALGHGPAPPTQLVRQVERIDPPEPLVIEDSTLAPGSRTVAVKPRPGLRVRVLRKAAGATQAELISHDYYPYERGVIRQSTAAAAPPAGLEQADTGHVPSAPSAPRPHQGSPQPAATDGTRREPAAGPAPGAEKNAVR